MEQEEQKDLFRLPKNVRQIGHADTQQKLYIEDYVMTLFRQLAKRSSMEYQMAVLLGNIRVSSNCRYIFVSGAVEVHELMLTEETEFTEETWSGIYGQIKEYFKEEEVLGWYLTRPGLSEVPDERMTKIHKKNFPGDERIIILFDSLGDRENLYITENEELKRMKGYFVYYEKNPNMQEYMIAQSENRSIENGYNDEQLMMRLRKMTQRKEEQKESFRTGRERLRTGLVYSICVGMMLLAIGCGILLKMKKNKDAGYPENAVPAGNMTNGGEQQNAGANKAETKDSLGEWERYDDSEEELKLPNIKGDTLKSEGKNNKKSNAVKELEKQLKDATNKKDGKENVQEEEREDSEKENDFLQETKDSPEQKEETEKAGVPLENKEDAEKIDPNHLSEGEEQKKQEEVSENHTKEEDSGYDVEEEQERSKETWNGTVWKTYVVEKGDTLASISLEVYHTTEYAKLIQEINRIEDINLIYIGQELLLPSP